MNKERRKKLQNIVERLEAVKSDLENVTDEEQTAYDNMPESLQETDRGDAMQEAIEAMESARDSIEEAIDSVKERF